MTCNVYIYIYIGFLILHLCAWHLSEKKTIFLNSKGSGLTHLYLSNSLPRALEQTKTFKIAFWMRKYGSMSWKRTWVWSNDSSIAALDLGAMTAYEKQTAVPTTVRYMDSKGRVRFKGNSTLKGSQILGFVGSACFSRLFVVMMFCVTWGFRSNTVFLGGYVSSGPTHTNLLAS